METMLYANEIRSTQVIAVDGAQVSPKELQMAVSLIENLSDGFDPQRYHDNYQAALKQLIDAKVGGAPLPALPSEQGEKVVDLMEALRASVEATRKKSSSQADGKAPATRTRTISSRRRKSA
jgi:DNA end-binding protein Ku